MFSAFVTKLLLREEVYDDKTEASARSEEEEVAADVCDKYKGMFQQPNQLATDFNKTGEDIMSGLCTLHLFSGFSVDYGVVLDK